MSLWEKKLLADDCLYATFNIFKLLRWRISTGSSKGLVQDNRAFRDLAKGKRCFVLGNGPSLSAEDLSKISGEDVFACNFFYKHPQAKACRPKYYFIVDPKLESGEWPASMIDELYAICSPELLFLNVRASKVESVHSSVRPESTGWLEISQTLNRFYRFNGGIDRPIAADNVTKAAIQVAVHMGYKEIYVLGVDGDGLFRDLLGERPHFYNVELVNENSSYDQMVKNLWFCTEGFRTWALMARSLRRNGVELFNASKSGLMNCLKRRRPSELI